MEVITTHRNVDFDALASVFAAKVLFPNGRLPVIQKGKLIGIITRSDAMRYFSDLMPE